MNDPKQTSGQSLEDPGELAEFIARPLIPIRIHVVGNPPRIVCHPGTATAHANQDNILWLAGANCEEWEVRFPDGDPLQPPGPYSSSGVTGGLAVVPGVHKYNVSATDTRTRERVKVDPDVVIIPGTK